MKELKVLFEISNLFSSNISVKECLEQMLQLLADELGYISGALYLTVPDTKELTIRVAHNLTDKEIKRGRYNIGEGITGKVVQSGKPVIVPVISREPDFLNKTRARAKHDSDRISFLCFPIKIEDQLIGTISVDKYYHEGMSFETDEYILNIVALIVAQAVRANTALELDKQELLYEIIHLKRVIEDKFSFGNIVGSSSAMQQVYEDIDTVSQSDVTVLIRGETGSGKELIANAIHYNSERKNGPFIKINCAAIPANLLESELFGYKKGAFTGAVTDKIGKFEAAQYGTIFLDEIGDIPPALQVKLLRVLQEKEIERLGENKSVKVNVRIIAATNKDLEDAMKKSDFREDLYYRLNVMQLYLPPLRERGKSDIIELAEFFLGKYAQVYKKSIKRISTPAINMMTEYHWPGNVRELQNCIERAVLTSKDNVIHGYHLPPSLQTAAATDTGLTETLPIAVNRLEREMIVEALKVNHGERRPAAAQLGITEGIFNGKCEYYNIDYNKYFRDSPGPPGDSSGLTFDDVVGRFERELLVQAIKDTGGNKKKAALNLGLSERIFNYKCSKYDLKYKEFRKK